MYILKKMLSKFKGGGSKQEIIPEQEQSSATEEINTLLDNLKNIFAKELLIDPRVRDFEVTTYGNSCRQRCNSIMETTTQTIEKIKNHIEQNEDLHKHKKEFDKFTEKIIINLQESSKKLNGILGNQEIEEKKRQLKCYNLGMAAQQSIRSAIDAYISTFNNTDK